MKAKMGGLMVVALHVVVLAVCLQMQGCQMFKSGGVKQDQPVVLPVDDSSTGGILPAGGTSVPSAPAAGSAEKTYTVKKGDTLSSIASTHALSWKELADYNKIANPNELKIGQEIRIPAAPGSTAPASSRPSVRPVSSRPVAGSIKQGSTYVVQKGDMLSTVAKRSGLTVAEIKMANSLTSDSIVAGKKLIIPKKGDVKAPAAAKAAPAVTKPAVAAAATAPAVSSPVPAPAPLADAAPASTVPVATAPAVKAPAGTTPVASATAAPVYEHVLYPGETLDDVARQYGSSQQEIMKLNNITDPASIKPGTKLLVPIPD